MEPATIITSSDEVGTTPPTQVEPVVQSPPAAVLLIVEAIAKLPKLKAATVSRILKQPLRLKRVSTTFVIACINDFMNGNLKPISYRKSE